MCRSSEPSKSFHQASEAFADEEAAVDKNKDDYTDTASNDDSNNDDNEASSSKSMCRQIMDFYWRNEFMILVVLAIPLARAYPKLGAYYLKPKYTATWLAVSFIFFLSGLTLRLVDLRKASLNMKFNALVLTFNFGVVSAIVFGISRALLAADFISRDLANGLTVCGCLPVTVNMAIVLSEIAGADRAAAVFITAVSNLSGVFISPLLILGYLGVSGDINLYHVFGKLALRVVVPMIVGQSCRYFEATRSFVVRNKPGFKRAQTYLLIYIIYTIFCRALKGGSDNSISDILLVILFQFLTVTSLMTLSWFTLKTLYPDQPKLRVTGLFGCTHKTISIGVPLINAIYGGHPNITLYTLPILIWHPMQLVIGTVLMPKLQAFIQSEHKRLGITDDTDAVLPTSSPSSTSTTTAAGPGVAETMNNPMQASGEIQA